MENILYDKDGLLCSTSHGTTYSRYQGNAMVVGKATIQTKGLTDEFFFYKGTLLFQRLQCSRLIPQLNQTYSNYFLSCKAPYPEELIRYVVANYSHKTQPIFETAINQEK